jgi:hypothetical protein
MIETFTPSIEADFTLPSNWTAAAHAAACTFPTMGGVSVAAGAAGTKRRIAGEGQVRLNTGTTADVFVLDGAYPGISVWSPPI